MGSIPICTMQHIVFIHIFVLLLLLAPVNVQIFILAIRQMHEQHARHLHCTYALLDHLCLSGQLL